MAQSSVPPNTVEITGAIYLLVEGGGQRVHLARQAEPGDQSAVAAVDDYHLHTSTPMSEPSASAYDRALLTERCWSPTTLCGRTWSLMAAAEGGPIVRWQEESYAPDCRACLHIVGGALEQSTPDERIPVIAELAAGAVVSHGSAQVSDVPGDQVDHLRKALRHLVKARGFASNTYVHDRAVFVWSDEAYEAIPQSIRNERDRDASRRISAALDGTVDEPIEPEWRFNWSAWG